MKDDGNHRNSSQYEDSHNGDLALVKTSVEDETIRPTVTVYESDDDWTFLQKGSDCSTTTDCNSRLANTTGSSMIVDQFELLSINGETIKQCRKCEANPTPYEDKLAARNLKEDPDFPLTEQDEPVRWDLPFKSLKGVLQESSSCSMITYRNSHVASSTTKTITTTSLVDKFDFLSVKTKTQCGICTRLNEENAVICAYCKLALVPNPCTETDAQLALNLKRKEEDIALDLLREEEAFRRGLKDMALEVRAQVLYNDLHRIIQSLFWNITNGHKPSEDVLVALDVLSRYSLFFITSVELDPSCKLGIGYHPTLKDSEDIGHIDFGTIKILDTVPKAISFLTDSIQEDERSSYPPPESAYIWIVAYIKPNAEGNLVEASNYLPLFRFQSVYCEKAGLELLQPLQVAAEDFFKTDWEASYAIQMNKRRRTENYQFIIHEEQSNNDVPISTNSAMIPSIQDNNEFDTDMNILDACSDEGDEVDFLLDLMRTPILADDDDMPVKQAEGDENP